VLQTVPRKDLLEFTKGNKTFPGGRWGTVGGKNHKGRIGGNGLWLRGRLAMPVLRSMAILRATPILNPTTPLGLSFHLQLLHLDLPFPLHLMVIQILEVIGVGLVLFLEEQKLLVSHEWLSGLSRIHIVDKGCQEARIFHFFYDREGVHELLARYILVALIGQQLEVLSLCGLCSKGGTADNPASLGNTCRNLSKGKAVPTRVDTFPSRSCS
jgi:hypothetical protein